MPRAARCIFAARQRLRRRLLTTPTRMRPRRAVTHVPHDHALALSNFFFCTAHAFFSFFTRFFGSSSPAPSCVGTPSASNLLYAGLPSSSFSSLNMSAGFTAPAASAAALRASMILRCSALRAAAASRFASSSFFSLSSSSALRSFHVDGLPSLPSSSCTPAARRLTSRTSSHAASSAAVSPARAAARTLSRNDVTASSTGASVSSRPAPAPPSSPKPIG
mmetsp:Transcript_25209/g.87942  ORF Transcript_25209/g.87942 Transcript_25209/m.87942 type:complete len:220 (-) Transcript_25209:1539-2198(-)